MVNKMTAEEIKKWQAEHLTPEKKEKVEELAKKYERKDIIDYSTLYNLLDLVGLLDECPCPVVQERDVDIVLAYGVKAGELIGVPITDNHIDMLHTFCADCGWVIPENEMGWAYRDEDGDVYCQYCKHEHMPEDED